MPGLPPSLGRVRTEGVKSPRRRRAEFALHVPPAELPEQPLHQGRGRGRDTAAGQCYLTAAPVSSPSPVLLGEGERGLAGRNKRRGG